MKHKTSQRTPKVHITAYVYINQRNTLCGEEVIGLYRTDSYKEVTCLRCLDYERNIDERRKIETRRRKIERARDRV